MYFNDAKEGKRKEPNLMALDLLQPKKMINFLILPLGGPSSRQTKIYMKINFALDLI